MCGRAPEPRPRSTVESDRAQGRRWPGRRGDGACLAAGRRDGSRGTSEDRRPARGRTRPGPRGRPARRARSRSWRGATRRSRSWSASDGLPCEMPAGTRWRWMLRDGAAGSGSEVALQRSPVHAGPIAVELLAVLGRETGVVEDESGVRSVRDCFEPHERVDTGRPGPDAPGLDDALVRDQLHDPARDAAAEQLEGAANVALNAGGGTRDRGELLLVEQGGVDSRGARLEGDFLVDGGFQGANSFPP